MEPKAESLLRICRGICEYESLLVAEVHRDGICPDDLEEGGSSKEVTLPVLVPFVVLQQNTCRTTCKGKGFTWCAVVVAEKSKQHGTNIDEVPLAVSQHGG